MSNPALRSNRTVVSTETAPAKRCAPDERSERRPRRPAWRQRLVEAERGFSHSFRADSALYLHIFVDTLLLATCGVLGLPATHWAIVIVGLTAMISAELFAQALHAIAAQLSDSIRKQVVSLCAAAKLLAILGSTSALGIVLWLRLRELFGG